jgi:hypothetical protein
MLISALHWDWWSTSREVIALLASIVALVASYWQSRQALHKARAELAAAKRADLTSENWGSAAAVSCRRRPEAYHAWKGTQGIDDLSESDSARRDVKHYAVVSFVWLLIVLGAVLAALAASLELAHDTLHGP